MPYNFKVTQFWISENCIYRDTVYWDLCIIFLFMEDIQKVWFLKTSENNWPSPKSQLPTL